MNDLVQLVENYTPKLEKPDEFKNLKIVLFVGITGAGKNMMISELLKTGEYYDLVTTISRPPRTNNGVMEVEGKDYYFVTPEQAVEKLKNGEYVEASLVHDRIYGITLDELRKAANTGKSVIGDIDTQGVKKIMKLSDNVVPIFVLPPTYGEWQRRVEGRYMNNEAFMADWPRRQASAIKEIEAALINDKYFFLINDQVDKAVNICDMHIRYGGPNIERDQAIHIARDILEQTKIKMSL